MDRWKKKGSYTSIHEVYCIVYCTSIHLIRELKKETKARIPFLFWTTSHSTYLFFSLSLTIHTQRRSGEHREGHWRHPLLTFFPLQQPALSVFRTGRRVKHWGRGAEANRKPVSIRPLLHGPAHLTHCWHFTLVHVIYPTLNNAKSHMWGYYNVSFCVLQWNWSGASTLSSERV